MVILVVVRELGLDHVVAAGHHPLGGLLYGRQVLVGLVGPRAVASDHVLGPVHCGERRGRAGGSFSRERLPVVLKATRFEFFWTKVTLGP